MLILLTNDDGIYAPGLAAMRAALEPLGEVVIVAPDIERSAAAHSITLDKPLRVRKIYVGDAFLGWAVDGSPVDCVKIAVKEVLERAPDLIVSGVNPGANVGINVLYSGTVAASLEGAILGHTSIAVSLANAAKPDFAAAGRIAKAVISQIIGLKPPKGSLFNVNLPVDTDHIAGVAIAPQATVSYDDIFDMRVDPRGGKYYWMTGNMNQAGILPDTDVALLASGHVTITPLQYDLTNQRMLKTISGWEIRI